MEWKVHDRKRNSTNQYPDASVQIEGRDINRMTHFNDLGYYITENLKPDNKIRCCIEATHSIPKSGITFLQR